MSNEPSGEYYDYTITMKPERPWQPPPYWKDVNKVCLSRITLEGYELAGEADAVGGGITLGLGADEALNMMPVDKNTHRTEEP